MVKSIDDLKRIIQDKMELHGGPEKIVINRSANNIIRIYGKLVSWKDLQDLLANGAYYLKNVSASETEWGTGSNWGGARVAGPGKKLGPSKKDPLEKKESTSLSLSGNTKNLLLDLCARYGKNRSEIIEMLISEKMDSFE